MNRAQQLLRICEKSSLQSQFTKDSLVTSAFDIQDGDESGSAQLIAGQLKKSGKFMAYVVSHDLGYDKKSKQTWDTKEAMLEVISSVTQGTVDYEELIKYFTGF